MNNILVPTDFSKEAQYALDFAIQWAKKANASITLLHVLELPSSSFSIMGEAYSSNDDFDNVFTTKLIEKTKATLQEWEDQATSAGVKTSSHLKLGNIFKHIYNKITENGFDLIIMGSTGASGLQEILIGSNTEKVIRHSEVPVITIKEPTDLTTIKNMVYATDFGHNQSVKLAKYIQELLGINVHLLKVYNTNRWSYTSESAKSELQRFAKDEEFENFTINVIDSPFVEDGILEFSQKVDADLIFMGTHGYTGVPHLLWGSRAESVANHSKKPVLTVKV